MQDGNGNDLSSFKFLDRGYTGHEHLLGVGLIHMNGRLYDPVLHRFLAPDNFVQDPYNTQNYNRYGYVLNNPLKYTDPSGEFFLEVGAALYYIIAGAIIVAASIWGSHDTGWSGGAYETPQAPISNSNNSQELAAMAHVPPISGSGYRLDNPYGVFQSGWLQSSTSSGLAYNTTGPNDWIANGSNVGRIEDDGYGDSFWERATNLDLWKKIGKEAIFGNNDPRIQKVGLSGLQTFLIPGGAGVKIFQRGFNLRKTFTSIRSGFLNLGKSFSQYKALYWAGKAKPALTPIINPKTGQVWKQYTELHHRFIPQRWKWAPNWLKNNRFNLKPVSSLQHAQMDPFRARFVPKWVKEMYNLTWK